MGPQERELEKFLKEKLKVGKPGDVKESKYMELVSQEKELYKIPVNLDTDRLSNPDRFVGHVMTKKEEEHKSVE